MKPRLAHPGPRARARRGASLVLFVILIFALMAVATLTLDVGSANLTQALMQDAVDSASLEGQRWRDYRDGLATFPDARRFRASELVSDVFDDDFDPSNGDTMNFGAGPVLDTNAVASGGLAAGSPPVYDPALRINRGNYPYGDFVSGAYDGSAPHGEEFDYTRSDFVPAPQGQGEVLSPAFLARMRRTNVSNPDDDVSSKSSKGPGVPLLFGRASTIRGIHPETYDPRREGLTVRATAIALAQPALSVGIQPADAAGQEIFPDADNPLHHRGVVPFALADGYWVDLPLLEGRTLTLDTSGAVARLKDSVSGEVVGFFVVDLLQVGREVVHTSAAPEQTSLDGYVPVYRLIDGVKRVVGYGQARLVRQGVSSSWTVTKLRAHLPLTGTCASLVWPVDPLTEAAWAQVFSANRELFSNEVGTGSVLAPAIAR